MSENTIEKNPFGNFVNFEDYRTMATPHAKPGSSHNFYGPLLVYRDAQHTPIKRKKPSLERHVLHEAIEHPNSEISLIVHHFKNGERYSSSIAVERYNDDMQLLHKYNKEGCCRLHASKSLF